MQSGLKLAFLLSLSDFKTMTGIGFLIKNDRVFFNFFEIFKMSLFVWPNKVFFADFASRTDHCRRISSFSYYTYYVGKSRSCFWFKGLFQKLFVCTTARLAMDCRVGIHWHFRCGCPNSKPRPVLDFSSKKSGFVFFFSESQKKSSYGQNRCFLAISAKVRLFSNNSDM